MTTVEVVENLTTQTVDLTLKAQLRPSFYVPMVGEQLLLEHFASLETRISLGNGCKLFKDATAISGDLIGTGLATATVDKNKITWTADVGCVNNTTGVSEVGLSLGDVLFMLDVFKTRYIPRNYSIVVMFELEIINECN